MSSINANQPVKLAPGTSQPKGVQGASDGIITNDHAGARTFMRVAGGLALAGGGVAAAMSFMSKTGVMSSASPVGPVVGALVGAGLVGFSFLKGLQPTRVPFTASGMNTLQDAEKKAHELGEDTAIYKDPATGKYALVNFAARDFDNEKVGNIDLGNAKTKWEGLVTKDGDLLKQVTGNEYQNVGRAYPDTVKLANVTSDADVDKLVGTQLGTNSLHGVATLGARVGDKAGYATWALATKAAYDSPGATAIVKAGDKYQLLEVKLPNGTAANLLAARGTGFTPVSGVSVQDDKKVLRAGSPGNEFGFVGRSTAFATTEPIGQALNGRTIGSLVRTSESAKAADDAIIADNHLVDDVFFGRTAGVTALDGTNPDNSHTVGTYNVTNAGGRGNWDQQLARSVGDLKREDSAWHTVQDQNWYDENFATETYTDFRRTDATLNNSVYGNKVLRTTGDIIAGGGVDYFATQQRRQYLRDARIAEEQAAQDRANQNRHPAGGDGPAPAGGDGPAPAGGDGPAPSRPSTPKPPSAPKPPSTGTGTTSGPGNPSRPSTPSHSSGTNSGPGNPGFSLIATR